MMRHRAGQCIATAILMLVTLSGCSSDGRDVPSPDKVENTVRSIGGAMNNLYRQKAIFRSVDAPDFDVQDIYIVPSSDSGTFQIVDSWGRLYSGYEDFLVRNQLTR